MMVRGTTERAWVWGMVTLAGVFPFASDMLRNFQLFAPAQLVGSFAAVVAATSAAVALAAVAVRLAGAEGRPASRRSSWPSSGTIRI